MRYSIFEYSQEKLISLGLDLTDALLLNWFANFFCGSMEKQIFKDSEGNSKVFGWVKTSKIIEDLPVLEISTERGIQKRMESFVEKGILERKIVITHKGKKSYYRTTTIYESLVNTNIQVSHKKTVDESTKTQDNKAKTSSSNPISKEKTDNTELKRPEKKNEEIVQKGNFKNPHTNSSSLAHTNSSSLAHTNSSSLAYSDSLITDKLIKDTAATISEYSDKLLGKRAFDAGFPKKAAAFLLKNGLKDFEGYFMFVKKHLDFKKDVINSRGLFYRLFFQEDIIQEFINKQEQKKRIAIAMENKKITCPCCGNHFLPDNMECPNCGLLINDFDNSSQINFQKQFISLSPEKQREYLSELDKIYNAYTFKPLLTSKDKISDLEREERELNIKYGIYELNDEATNL